jgi:DNA-binding SARP family transcriptional activator
VREPRRAHDLLSDAAAAGSGPAQRLHDARSKVTVSALGGLAVTVGGQPVPIPPGRSADVLRTIIAAGGSIGAERLIEAVWPGEAPERGRQGLRNALHRLPHRNELVVREHDLVRLVPAAVVDAEAFARLASHARRVMRTDPAAGLLATADALACYTGDLLPEDDSELVGRARDRLRGIALGIAETAARLAGSDRPEDVAWFLAEARAVDPDDEALAIRLARAQIAAGRVADARRTLADIRARGAELGVAPPDEIMDLERDLRSNLVPLASHLWRAARG